MRDDIRSIADWRLGRATTNLARSAAILNERKDAVVRAVLALRDTREALERALEAQDAAGREIVALTTDEEAGA